ncbi:5'-methylthioadenosine/adenosylhomocysteine nucleosidase [Bradyrhizobium aeschynomenes]|uniref:5'-methylthioadenosine/adenosylhomocysteine nucleosidase n=1 Tax=Bradyrhizobium aeschynomenes TaxID=2734909 RepID=UPI001AEE0C6B|nr:5'-methylthioadenosine/adenosylhomocysteine nucleosidase [Bradyrhizobium aeschynomenes]
MKIGIMGAMPEEVSGIIEQLETSRMHRIGGREYLEGTWNGIDVVVVFSRWGKVAASVTATMLLSRFGVDGIFFIGVAGAADPGLRLGDVVVATDLLQHDMDASAIPAFSKFEIPLLGRSRFPADDSWMSASLKAADDFVKGDLEAWIGDDVRASLGVGNPRVVTGLIATGDRFVTDVAFLRDLRKVLPDLSCVEMEGAAVAQTCFEFTAPFAVVRVISDRGDDGAPVDFKNFVSKVASRMSLGIASNFTRTILARVRSDV